MKAMNNKKISIIIPNWNGENLLFNCLKSIYRINWPYYEIIVVDNGSVDNSVDLVKQNFPQAVLIENKKNLGFARACNQGAKIAQGEILFFLNSDTEIKNNIFEPIYNFFVNFDKVGIVSPCLILPDGSPQPWAFLKKEGLLSFVLRKFEKQNFIIKDKPIEVDAVSGAALAIRKNIFKQIGGFDERFFMYYEDNDICLRTKKRGYKVVYYPLVQVVHLQGGSLSNDYYRKKFYYQSQNYYWRKHFGLVGFLIRYFMALPFRCFTLLKLKKNLNRKKAC